MSVYFTIKRTTHPKRGDRLEYHIGRDRHDLSMSKALNLEHCTAAQVAAAVEKWHEEAVLYELKPV